jgi:hypothetical protein
MAYCTIDEFFEYSDLDQNVVDSSLIQSHINRAYKQIVNESGTYFASTINNSLTVTEVLDPTPNKTDVANTYLVLNNYPVQQLSTISINGTSVATSDFLIYTDRIKIKPSPSTTYNFGVKDQNVLITYKYGVVDEYKFGLAKQLNIMMAMLDFFSTPKGRNIYMDNSRLTEINHNDIRPNDMVNTFLTDLRTRIMELKDQLGVAHKFF